jgi:UDP-N-acetylglucosamine 3-dehydrogenase
MPERSGLITIAVSGGGQMGARHARTIAAVPGVRLAGIIDADPDAVAVNAVPDVPRYDDLPALLAGQRIDAVCVAVPTASHHAVALEAVAAGLHVLVEKPIASTLTEADDLIAAAEAAGVVLAVGHVERHNPAIHELRRLIVEGTLGDISSLLARRVGGVPPRRPATNVIVDLAVHDIDVMSYLMDTPPSLLAAHGSRTFHGDRHDSAELLLRVGTASGFVQANWVTPAKVRTLTVTGSRGMAEANYVSQELRVLEASWRDDIDDFSEFVAAFGRPRQLDVPVARQEPLWNEIIAFVADIRHGSVSRSVSARDGRHALSVALEASARLPA